MLVSPQQTVEAYWLLYQSLPGDIRRAIRQRINTPEETEKPPTDFTKLASTGWDEGSKNYDHNELYD